MDKNYSFICKLKENLKINFKTENVIFLEISYKMDYFYINSKNKFWLKEYKFWFKYQENFSLNIDINFFQNYCNIIINNKKLKYYYQVDPSYFNEPTVSNFIEIIKIPNENNIITYSEYLKDKKVVIVAPGGYLKGLKKGNEIDNYDIVVRLNTALPIKESLKEDVGSKTHILYNCLSKYEVDGGIIDFDNLMLDWIACPYPQIYPFRNDIKQFHLENKSKFRFHIIEKYFYYNLENKMGTRPNTGIGAILDLLEFPIKELYITGFTFLLKSGYLTEYKSFIDNQDKLDELMKTNNHDRFKQVKYIKPILLNDNRIKMDKLLIDLLNEFE